MKRNKRRSAPGPIARLRNVNYSTSPLLASRTPPWRSKLLVALVCSGFCVLIGRAVYVQVHRQRVLPQAGRDPLCAHARPDRQPRPHPRPQRRDPRAERADAVAVGDPEGPRVDAGSSARAGPAARHQREGTGGQARRPAQLRLAAPPGRRGAGQGRCSALGIKGIYKVSEFKRRYPEGEATAHVVGFTNVEDQAARKASNSRSRRNWPAATAAAA